LYNRRELQIPGNHDGSTSALRHVKVSFYEQPAQNLVIETGLEGIESAKRNNNDTTLRQNALNEIELKKSAVMVYTDGSIMGEERGVGV
jgi:ribonuclease HI